MKIRKIDIHMPFTREELVNSREYKIAGAALNDISNIDEEYADNEDYIGGYVDGFENGAGWADAHQNHWHDAQGDDLPPIDKEVIVLRNNEQIAFGHRPNPDGEVWKHPDGTLEHVHFKTYDKGGWNIPNIKWWCDINLPKGGGDHE